MRIIVTGGAGFIGSHLVNKLVKSGHHVLNIDLLTYAANLDYLRPVEHSNRYHFLKNDICEGAAINHAFISFKPDVVMHLAAESHVDRSIACAQDFLHTNVNGTFSLLEASLSYWESCSRPDYFRFVHVSTDEVYGALEKGDPLFNENSQYLPNSPYSASKAASDHLVRAWHKTYGLPAIITHCSNNFGPHQHAEKLIPTIIRNALAERPLPIYGTGENIRDWIYVGDHVNGLIAALEKGRPGEVYNFGGNNEISNLDMVHRICSYLDQVKPRLSNQEYARLITHVEDRKGHDFRYALCNDKSSKELGWEPECDFESGLSTTIDWYLAQNNSSAV